MQKTRYKGCPLEVGSDKNIALDKKFFELGGQVGAELFDAALGGEANRMNTCSRGANMWNASFIP